MNQKDLERDRAGFPRNVEGRQRGDSVNRMATQALFRNLVRAQVRHLLQLNPWLLLILPALYVVTAHVVAGRYPISASYAPNVIWGYEWAEQVRHGILYPRWMERTYVGLGSPSFHFYGPLCMYSMLPFSVGLGLSISTSVLLSFWSALFVMALGMARLTGTLFAPRHRWLSGVVAVMTLMSSYTLCNVYVRGALAETWAMAILPWLIDAMFRSVASTRFAARLALIGISAFFALCHPPLLLFGAGSIGLAVLMTSRSWKDLWCWIRRAMLPMLFGLGLDAHYLVSAIRDQAYVQIDALTANNELLAYNHVLVPELGHLSLKTADGFEGSMVPGFLFCCLAIVVGLRLLIRVSPISEEVNERRMVFLLTMAATSAMMMTDLSRGVYSLVPALNKAQFAWRWMAILSITSLPLWGYALLYVTRGPQRKARLLRIPVWLISIWSSTQVFGTTLGYVDWNKADSQRTDQLLAKLTAAHRESDASALPIKEFRGLIHVNAKNDVVLEDVPEYKPKLRVEGGLPPRTFAQVEWRVGQGNSEVTYWGPGKRRFVVDSPTGGEILVRTSAWHGWETNVNGIRAVGDESGDWGRMVVKIPKGHSNVEILYRGTSNQRKGVLISGIFGAALALYAAWLLWRFRGSRTGDGAAILERSG